MFCKEHLYRDHKTDFEKMKQTKKRNTLITGRTKFLTIIFIITVTITSIIFGKGSNYININSNIEINLSREKDCVKSKPKVAKKHYKRRKNEISAQQRISQIVK
jgi:hypothetical protein